MKRSREPEEHLEADSSADATSRHVAKIPGLDSAVEDEDKDKEGFFAMRCSLPPHKEPLGFRHYSDYEAHYQTFHTNRCLTCRKNFPTEHLLGVHIEECHDPLARVARERGEHTYSCFVEGCQRKCMTPQKRRLHLIDKHLYPKNFFFAVTKDGVDGRRSLLIDGSHHRRRSSTGVQQQHPKEKEKEKENERRASTLESEAPQKQQDDGERAPRAAPGKDNAEDKTEQHDTDMAELAGAMSALHFVPPSIRFGRGRAGFSKR